MKILLYIATFVASIVLIILIILSSANAEELLVIDKCKVTKVIDGDTLYCKSEDKEYRIRLRSIDTPEISFGKDECFGRTSTDYLRKKVNNKEIKFQSDGIGKYGRQLAYIFLGDEFINLDLVLKGYAKAKVIEYQNEYFSYDPWIFYKAQEIAKSQKFGMWGKCEVSR